MNTQKKSFASIFKAGLSLLLLLFFNGTLVQAQSEMNANGNEHTVYFNGESSDKGEYQDYIIPNSDKYQYLHLTARGGDGGRKEAKSAITDDNIAKGGRGAMVEAYFKIGNGAGEIPPGSLIRFIIGGHGKNVNNARDGSGSGGGGTGIAFKHSGKWKLLMIAGGGSGGATDCCMTAGWVSQGDPGKVYVKRLSGAGNRDDQDRSDYDGGSVWEGNWKDGPDEGEPTGASNTYGGDFVNGGWGVGPGGLGTNLWNADAGGGGGYTGGDPGEGGTSYINEDQVLPLYLNSQSNGRTSNPESGYATYRFTRSAPKKQVIHAKKSSNYVIAINGPDDNRSDAWLYENQTDKDSVKQQWYFEDFQIKLAANPYKCLDRKGESQANGTVITLYDCKGSDNQLWVYDGVTRQLRAKTRLDHCIELKDGNTSNGAAIQLWDCNQHTRQQWNIDNLPYALSASEPTSAKRIKLATTLGTAQEKCLDLYHTTVENQAKINLWNCNGTSAQRWVFAGKNQIRLALRGDYCLDVKSGDTSNGAVVQLYECHDGDNQEWLYDGITNEIRWRKHLDKCLDNDHGRLDNGNPLQIWDCNGADAQKWVIE